MYNQIIKCLAIPFILISCTVTPIGDYYVGRTRELLLIDKGNPTTISDTTNGQIWTYWTRNKLGKKVDVVKIHNYYLDKKENIYKYSTSVSRFSK